MDNLRSLSCIRPAAGVAPLLCLCFDGGKMVECADWLNPSRFSLT